MQIKDVHAFIQAADAGSLHAAAQVLGVTQPALTKAIQRLEVALGVMLFERSARGVALTSIGKMFYARGRALDGLVDHIRMEIADHRSGDAGLIRLGVVPAVMESVVVPTLAHFIDGPDPLRFDMHVQLSSALLRYLRAGQLDLAIAAMPAELHSDLNFTVLGNTAASVVVRKGHALTRRAFTLHDLARQKWLLPPQDLALTQWIVSMFREADLEGPLISVQHDATPAVFSSLVRSTSLLTVMTDEMLGSSLGVGLVKLPAPAASWDIKLALFWRRKAQFSRPMERCRAELAASFARRKLR